MKLNKLREQVAEAFIASLKEEKLPWHAMWATSPPHNAISGKAYRGINSFWLSFVADHKGYSDSRWCTFKQASEKGWHVKAGEKASTIEYWRLFDKQQKKYIEPAEARDIIQDDPQREKDIVLSSRVYSVFNAAQIEGIPPQEHRPGVDIGNLRQKRDTLLANMGLGFREGGDQAFYRPSNDSITMPPESSFYDTYGYMSTFLHEAGHATGAPHRLNRDMSGGFGSVNYAKEELRAEIASAFVSQALGFGREGQSLGSGLDNHRAYIQSWIEVIQDKPNELFAAIKDAEGISDYLLEKGDLLKDLEQAPKEKKDSLDSQISAAKSRQEAQIQVTVAPIPLPTR